MSRIELKDGEPCGHAGCLNHISHPCEGCGRIGGKTKRSRIEASVMTPDRCPCGDVIYANTEDWETPLCYECYIKMTEELSPCPDVRCKSKDVYMYYHSAFNLHFIKCRVCGFYEKNRSKRGLIKHWNTRPSCWDCINGEMESNESWVECSFLGDSFAPDFYCKQFKRK